MNYTLNQLQIFWKISQTKSITKAAEELNLTQPAVSIQLRNFQNQFDIPLTEVIGRQLYVTEFGKEIALVAEQILNQVEEINFKTSAFKGQISGRLKLSVVSTGKYVIPYFLTDFLKLYPGVELTLDVTNKTKVIENIANNDVDFSMVSVLPEHLNIDNLELMQNKLFLVTGKSTNFSEKEYDISILNDIPIIYREPGSGTRFTMERYFENHGILLKKKMELTSNEAVKQAIIAGLGSSVMPLIGIKSELMSGDLKIIPIKGFPIISNWQLIWQKNKGFSPVAKAFLAYLQQEKENIINSHFSWFEKY
ncbi:MAG: LysR family transcriptional regulator [Crocinitomicaceae bacterium]|nr:LysR family transcriptional regulator [Crocinitomicaceae bacterium]